MLTKLKLAYYTLTGTARTVGIQWQNSYLNKTSTKSKKNSNSQMPQILQVVNPFLTIKTSCHHNDSLHVCINI